VALLYPKVADAIQQVGVNRFAAAEAIVMHPRRWAWITAALDSQNRPLVVPEANSAQNAVGVFARPTAAGADGAMQGLPVFLDATSRSPWALVRTRTSSSCRVSPTTCCFEDPDPTVAVYEGVLSANLQVRILCYGYFAFTFARYAKANSIISGDGPHGTYVLNERGDSARHLGSPPGFLSGLPIAVVPNGGTALEPDGLPKVGGPGTQSPAFPTLDRGAIDIE
jgi:hypothetical protein